MVKIGYFVCLLEEFLTKAANQATTTFRAKGDLARRIVPLTIILHEKLFDGNLSTKTALLAEIGDAEASLPENTLNNISPILQLGVRT